VTVNELAARARLSRRTVKELICNKRKVTKRIAKRLSRVWRVSYRVWQVLANPIPAKPELKWSLNDLISVQTINIQPKPMEVNIQFEPLISTVHYSEVAWWPCVSPD
jgi:plasmid maintenance system antidote protein VapI